MVFTSPERIPLPEKVALIDSLVATLDLQTLQELVTRGDALAKAGLVPPHLKDGAAASIQRTKLLLFYAIELSRLPKTGEISQEENRISQERRNAGRENSEAFEE